MLTSGGNRDVLLSNVKTRCLVKQSSVVLRGWRGEIQLHREATVGAGGLSQNKPETRSGTCPAPQSRINWG